MVRRKRVDLAHMCFCLVLFMATVCVCAYVGADFRVCVDPCLHMGFGIVLRMHRDVTSMLRYISAVHHGLVLGGSASLSRSQHVYVPPPTSLSDGR